MPFPTPAIFRQMALAAHQGSQNRAPTNSFLRSFATQASSATPTGLKLAIIITLFTVPPLILVAMNSFTLTTTLTSRPRKFEPSPPKTAD